MPLSRDNDFQPSREYGVDAPPGYVEVWGIDSPVKITDIKNRRIEHEEIPEDKGWVQYCVGLDPSSGHGRDRTALCVARVRYDRQDNPRTEVLFLRRLRKGLFFREVSSQVRDVVEELKHNAEERGLKSDITVLVDSGGLGEALAEGIFDALRLFDCRAVYLTSGGYGMRTEENGKVFVSKVYMVSLITAAIERGHIHFPKKLKELDALKEEMQSFGEKISEATGNSTFGAMSTGVRDDEITSIGLCLVGAHIGKPIQLY